jgi:hypothetical protein
VDKDGEINYGKTIVISNAATPQPNVYPRLITGNAPVIVTYPQTTQAAFVQLVGMDGKVWQTKSLARGSAQTSIKTSNLAKGCYVVVFISNGMAVTMQVLKE